MQKKDDKVGDSKLLIKKKGKGKKREWERKMEIDLQKNPNFGLHTCAKKQNKSCFITAD